MLGGDHVTYSCCDVVNRHRACPFDGHHHEDDDRDHESANDHGHGHHGHVCGLDDHHLGNPQEHGPFPGQAPPHL